MAIKTLKNGPGTLSFGEVGSPMDVSSQVTSCKIAWSVDTADDVTVLSGEVLPGDDTFTASLSATFLQDDLAAAGLVRWSWTNKGTSVPFRYIPDSANGTEIDGTIRVRPLDLGGDVNVRNTSDVEFPCVGEPTIVDPLG